MPVGRHRKPFSNKQKKEQLQAKREKKRNRGKKKNLILNHKISNFIFTT
jgi:hypothetical protein